MSDPAIASVVLALLATVLIGVVIAQRTAMNRAARIAESMEDAARASSADFDASESAEGSLGDRFARAARAYASGRTAESGRTFLRALVTSVNEPVLVHGERIEAANPAMCALLGREPAEVPGSQLASLVAPEYAGLVAANVGRRLAGQPASELTEVEVVDAHGQLSRLELRGTTFDLGSERLILFTALEMLPAPAAGGGSAKGLRAQLTLDSLGDGVVTTDFQGHIDYMNRTAEKLVGVTLADALGKQLTDLVRFVDEHDRRALPDPVRHSLSRAARVGLGRRALMITHATAAEYSIELSAAPMRAERGEIAGVAVVLHDVTDLRGYTRQMSYQASHDALTGLVNRREFERRLADAVETAHGGEAGHVLCYLDLDRFKAVNDSCGHVAGDNMLREVAALLKDAVRDSDTVGRLGGDEFGVLLIGCPLEKAQQIGADVCRAINDYRFVWKDQIFSVGVSVGLVEVGRESGEIEDVMAAADSACYVAKQRNGGQVHVYSARDEAVARHSGEIQWLQRLQVALRDGRFELFVQPIIEASANAGNGPGMEVLLRLRDDKGVAAVPADFMQAAERYRLMSLVDRWVVQTALAALASGAIRLPDSKSLAINLSGQTLADPAFLEFVVETLDRTGVRPAQLCFELTENSVAANPEMSRRFIGVLHGMGCQFALDDFGNDLGGVTQLRNLSMDFLKIDGSYLQNLSKDAVNQAIVAGIVRLARTLNFRLVAEQVEDEASLAAIRGMGIDFAQGYIIGRPEPLRPAA